MKRLVASLLLLAATSLAAQPTPQQNKAKAPYTQLYVFGDSYSDTGAGFVYTNGATAVAYLAQRLGIPFTYYRDANSKGKGLNFAVSAGKTGSDPGVHEGTAVFRLGMQNQVQQFAELLKAGTIHFDPAQTMFFLAGGLNDRGTPEAYTRTNLEQEIDALYALGARRFMVALLPVKIPAFDTAGIRLNPELAKIPAEEQAKHPEIRIANSDWGPFFDRVITHPSDYGITNTTSVCAALRAGPPEPCASPETYFYFYEAHPSTAAHKAVGEMLYQEALSKAP